MKILFDHPDPFMLAHGGFSIQIEQTRQALLDLGVEVEFLRWWDFGQESDLIHYFGRPATQYIELAHKKGKKLVFSALHTALGSRSNSKRFAQRTVSRVVEAVLPEQFTQRLGWKSYRTADACIVLTSWEAHLVQEMFRAPASLVHIVPNGVEAVFHPAPVPRGEWLLTTAVIRHGKRVLETGQAAVAAQTPYWVIGSPFSEKDEYHQAWLALCRAHPKLLRYEPGTNDRAKLAAAYQQARGFVLLSQQESLSIAALEASGCACPLLLTDLPWARSVFGPHARYAPLAGAAATARHLRSFYDAAPALPPPPAPKSWRDVALQLRDIYARALKTS